MKAAEGERARRQAVADFFSASSASWRDRYSLTTYDAHKYQTRARIALSWAGSAGPAGRLLDIGCGAGIQSAMAARQGWTVVAADLSPAMLQQAARELPGPRWTAAAAEALPFRAHTFDVVMMLGVVDYVNDPVATLRRVGDLLRPGGRLIISWRSPETPLLERLGGIASALPQRLYDGLKRLLRGRIERYVGGDGFYDRFARCWTQAAFAAVLEAAGFRVLDTRAFNFGQFRFMGKALWPERMDVHLTALLERCVTYRPFRGTAGRARSCIALAERGGS